MNAFTLYELTESYLNLLELTRSQEDDLEIEKHASAIEDAIESKLEGYAVIISELEADIEKFSKEKTRIDGIIKQRKNSVERLKRMAHESMKAQQKEKIETAHFRFNIRQNPPRVEVTDSMLIPEEFLRIKKEVNRAEIKKALSEGKEVAGAELVTSSRLDIR